MKTLKVLWFFSLATCIMGFIFFMSVLSDEKFHFFKIPLEKVDTLTLISATVVIIGMLSMVGSAIAIAFVGFNNNSKGS